MTNTRDVILKLKEVKREKGLSLDKILVIMEKNGQFLSKSTLSRVFADGSEDKSFRYDETLRPIANALLDIENDEIDDDAETLAFKSILKLKMSVIDENSKKIAELTEEVKTVANKERQKYHEKLDAEIAKHQKSLDFAMQQIELKDKRIDLLMQQNERLSVMNNRMLEQFMDCPLKKQNDEKV